MYSANRSQSLYTKGTESSPWQDTFEQLLKTLILWVSPKVFETLYRMPKVPEVIKQAPSPKCQQIKTSTIKSFVKF